MKASSKPPIVREYRGKTPNQQAAWNKQSHLGALRKAEAVIITLGNIYNVPTRGLTTVNEELRQAIIEKRTHHDTTN